MLSISEMLLKYDLFQYFESWFNNSTHFQPFQIEKELSEVRSKSLRGDAWSQFCHSHPDMHVAQTCFENMSIQQFWSISDEQI